MGFIDVIAQINYNVNSFVWGPVMLLLLVGTGVYLTFRTNFFQFRNFATVIKKTIGSVLKSSNKKLSKGSVTPFQAMTTAIASTVGVGNVAGVATAIVSGGAGAIFWMWISALFGMMTKYGEVLLAVKYRQHNINGGYYGGPMYYISKGLKMNWLASLFAIFGTLACFGIGNMNQSYEIAAAAKSTIGLSPIVTGVIVAVIVAVVIIGGITRIGKVTEKVVPLMAGFYILGGVIALIINAEKIPSALASIFTGAFSMESVGGGVMGYAVARAMRFGIARGVFSNEAGLGSAPIAHAAADTNNPVNQAMWGIFEVFLDTIVICTITSLVILTSGLNGVATDASGALVSGGALTSLAYESVFGRMGGMFVSVAIIFFAVSTILGWSYYGEQCLGFLTDNDKGVIKGFRIVYVAFILVGALGELQFLWGISDTLNGLMAIPNLMGILGLSGVIIDTTKKYLKDPNSVKLHR